MNDYIGVHGYGRISEPVLPLAMAGFNSMFVALRSSQHWSIYGLGVCV